MEMPGRWGGMIDVGGAEEAEGAEGEDDFGQIVRALHADELDDQLCVRDGSWYAARLVRDDVTTPRRACVDPDRWHVVLGGASAAPAVAALTAAGARRLLLAGDVPEPGDEALDGEVAWRRCEPGELGGTLTGLGPLGDVIAVAEPAPTRGLASLTEQDVTGGLANAVLLEEIFRALAERKPRRLTVITSAAPGWGSVNTAGSAGAAGWLTGWAQRAAMPAGVLALMPREDTGELTDAHRALFEQSGLRLLTAADGADLIRRGLLAEPGVRSAALVDLRRYVRICQDLAPRAFLGSLTAAEPAEPPDTELRERLLALPDALPGHVAAVVAKTLGMPAAELDPERGFFDLGMDSVMALAVRTRLEDDLGLELASTLTFEYSTVADLADYLRSQLAPGDDVTDVLAEEIEAAKRLLAGHGDEEP
jgi:acyl carrier protein